MRKEIFRDHLVDDLERVADALEAISLSLAAERHVRFEEDVPDKVNDKPAEASTNPYPKATLLAAMAVRAGLLADPGSNEAWNNLMDDVLRETEDIHQFRMWQHVGCPTFSARFPADDE